MSTTAIVVSAVAPLFSLWWIATLTGLSLIIFALCMRMRTRFFYFVRHGETILNAKHIKQGAEGGLSDKGKKQAAETGSILALYSINKILSSPYERSVETATIINESLHVPVEYSPLLVERRNPSAVIGKSVHDPEVARIVEQTDLAYHDDQYRFLDEENFEDLKKRAQLCLAYFAQQRERRICVVTHHAFLIMLYSYMRQGESLHASDYIKHSFFNFSENGSISVCAYHPWKKFFAGREWEILTYNN